MPTSELAFILNTARDCCRAIEFVTNIPDHDRAFLYPGPGGSKVREIHSGLEFLGFYRQRGLAPTDPMRKVGADQRKAQDRQQECGQ